MAIKEIETKVKTAISEQLGIPSNSIKLDANFSIDLGADSLDVVEIVMVLEEEFDMEIPDDTAGTMVTVQDVINYVVENKKS